MALISSAPITEDGKTYDKLSATIVVNPMIQDSAFKTSVVVTLLPYCVNEDESISSLPGETKNIIISDLESLISGDSDLASAMGGIMGVLQGYITAKGL